MQNKRLKGLPSERICVNLQAYYNKVETLDKLKWN